MRIQFLISFLCLSLLVNAQEAEPLFIGDQAPKFKAKDQYGNSIDLKELYKTGPVVLFFYRGQWCPVCNRHMSDVQDSLKFITDYGAHVLAITPEISSEVDKSIEKTGASFSIISDDKHKIMDDYKVTYKVSWWQRFFFSFAGYGSKRSTGNKDKVLPKTATYIIDTDGSIFSSHFYESYKYRMSVKEITEILERLKYQ